MPSRQVAHQFLQSQIDNNQVVVFSKSYCPYCVQTKQLFRKTTLPADTSIVVVELDELEDGYLYQQELQAMTGQRTVPNVFVNGQHVGGNDETQRAKRNGRLQKLLSRPAQPVESN